MSALQAKNHKASVEILCRTQNLHARGVGVQRIDARSDTDGDSPDGQEVTNSSTEQLDISDAYPACSSMQLAIQGHKSITHAIYKEKFVNEIITKNDPLLC